MWFKTFVTAVHRKTQVIIPSSLKGEELVSNPSGDFREHPDSNDIVKAIFLEHKAQK